MKYLILITLAALLIGLSSCNQDAEKAGEYATEYVSKNITGIDNRFDYRSSTFDRDDYNEHDVIVTYYVNNSPRKAYVNLIQYKTNKNLFYVVAFNPNYR